MNARIILTPAAEDDLVAIWRYVVAESHNEGTANRLLDDIGGKSQLYAERPELGELRPDLAPGVRCFPVGQYVVFYRPAADGIDVLRILHGMRDIPVAFRGH